MFTCPSCNTKSIPVESKLSCTWDDPIICSNCKTILRLSSVSKYAVIASFIFGVLLFPILSGAAFVYGIEAIILGYMALAGLITGFAILSKLGAIFEFDNPTDIAINKK